MNQLMTASPAARGAPGPPDAALQRASSAAALWCPLRLGGGGVWWWLWWWSWEGRRGRSGVVCEWRGRRREGGMEVGREGRRGGRERGVGREMRTDARESQTFYGFVDRPRMMNRIGLGNLVLSHDFLKSQWECLILWIPSPRVGTLKKVATDVIPPWVCCCSPPPVGCCCLNLLPVWVVLFSFLLRFGGGAFLPSPLIGCVLHTYMSKYILNIFQYAETPP